MLQTRNDTLATANDLPYARLERLLAAARSAGADAADAVFAQSRALSIGVRKGDVETVERDETSDLGLRVFVGKKQAVVSVSEFSQGTLDRLVDRAVAMARLAPDDAYAGLADPDLLYTGGAPDLDLYDDSHLSAEALQARALEVEAAGLDFAGSEGNVQSDAATTGYTQNQWWMLTSGGFRGTHRTSLFYQSGRFIATDALGNMERDGEGRSVRHLSDLPPPAETGRIGAERAAAALGARKIETQKAAVLFDKRIAKSLVSQFLGAISGGAIARGSSFLKDKLGQAVLAPGITILDDPFRPRGLGSCAFDDEGVAVSRRALIDDGVLTTWLLGTAQAKQLGLSSTGHASRSLASAPGVSVHNAVLLAGTPSPQDLMTAAVKGVVITSMFGPSVNSDTGDWSAGASGFWFENGVIAYPVNELTVAGNLIDMLARLVPASDLDIRGSVDAPSIFIDGLSLGGK